MKYICKDFWTAVYKKQIDNLRTNHQVCIWLIDHITCLFYCFVAAKVKFSRHWILCLVGKKGCFPSTKNFGFEILEIPGAQWNSIFWFHRPKPRYCAFGYCTCFQDTKEQFLGQQFCQMELQTFQFDWMKWPDWSKWTTFKGDPNIIISVEPNQNGPFHLISNQNFQNFGLNKRCPKSAWIDEYAPLSIATCCTLR